MAVISKHNSDRAKREFTIDSVYEVKRIKERYLKKDNKGRMIKPGFFGHVSKTKGYYDSSRKNYKSHQTTMDFLQKSIKMRKREYQYRDFIPFSAILKDDPAKNKVNHEQVRRVIAFVRASRASVAALWCTPDDILSASQKATIAAEIRQEAIEYVENIKMSSGTMRNLLVAIEKPCNSDISRSLFFTLFGTSNKSFYSLINESKEVISTLAPNPDGEVELYGRHFSYIS